MIYRFGPFELDTAKVELRERGTVRPVEPQVYAVLALLVANRERLVSTDELIEKVWGGRVISDAAVASRIRSVRRALGDDGKRQAYVRTLPRQGFRFVADVRVARESADEAVAPAQPTIAVMPFRRIGAGGAHEFMADALPHDLIAELSRLRWLLVTARGSSFRLREDDLDPVEAGHLLGVRYCLTGTVEVSGERLTVVVELTDIRRGDIVWAERFTGRIDDVHSFRADMLAHTLAALELRVPLHEATLPAASNSIGWTLSFALPWAAATGSKGIWRPASSGCARRWN